MIYDTQYTGPVVTEQGFDNDGNVTERPVTGASSPQVRQFSDRDPASATFSPGEEIFTGDNQPGIFHYYYVGHDGNTLIVNFVIDNSDGTDDGGNLQFFGPEDKPAGTPLTIVEEDKAVCFMAGTMIATPAGERRVEELVAGDAVVASDGATRAVKWMWRQTIVTVFADALRGLPVTVKAGALGDNLPVRDLNVSPDHALLVEGMLVHAGALVNGTSVVRMTGLPERFTYYHIELEDHALVMAEGVAAETFVDNVTRRRFDNWAEYEAMFGDKTAIDELDLPRVKSARQLPSAMRARLQRRAVALDDGLSLAS